MPGYIIHSGLIEERAQNLYTSTETADFIDVKMSKCDVKQSRGLASAFEAVSLLVISSHAKIYGRLGEKS